MPRKGLNHGFRGDCLSRSTSWPRQQRVSTESKGDSKQRQHTLNDCRVNICVVSKLDKCATVFESRQNLRDLHRHVIGYRGLDEADWVHDAEGGVLEPSDEIGEVAIGSPWPGENGAELERKKICSRLWSDMRIVAITSMDGAHCQRRERTRSSSRRYARYPSPQAQLEQCCSPKLVVQPVVRSGEGRRAGVVFWS